MEDSDIGERIATLEAEMKAVLTLDSRITRLERVMFFVGGVASVSGLGAAPQLIQLIGG